MRRAEAEERKAEHTSSEREEEVNQQEKAGE